MERKAARIDWLDYARFLCAMAVLCFHYLSPGIEGYTPFIPDYGPLTTAANYGYLGVDFFFMVSGYVIMMSAAGRSASEFAVSRIIRLYPTYLFALVLTGLVLALAQNPTFPVTLWQWIINLSMVSILLGVEPVDSVYWTLAFEVIFYGAVLALLFFGMGRKLERCLTVWIAMQGLSFLLDVRVPLFSGYFLLFSAGCLLYFGNLRGWTPWRSLALLALFGMNLSEIMYRGQVKNDLGGLELSSLALGGVLAVFFAAFLFFSRVNVKLPYARFVGSLTYPLYLVHQFIGYIALGWLVSFISPALAVVVVTFAMLVLSAFVVEYVENRPRAVYRRWAEALVTPLRWLEGARFWVAPPVLRP